MPRGVRQASMIQASGMSLSRVRERSARSHHGHVCAAMRAPRVALASIRATVVRMSPLDRIKTYHPELTAIRQDFHANPELGFEEHRTSDIVARKLEALGIEVHRGVGGTG